MPEVDEFDAVGVEPDETLSDDFEPESDESAETVRIGDREIPTAQALELIMMGEDYRKKTQQVANERRELEAKRSKLEIFEQMEALWERDPNMVLQHLTEQAGGGYRNGASMPSEPNINLDDFTDNEKLLYRQNQELKEMVKGLTANVTKFQGVAQELLTDRDAAVAARSIRKEHGAETDAIELRALMQKHKTNDPVAAWKVENFDKVKTQSAKAGAAAASRPMPEMARNESRRVVPKTEWSNAAKWPTDRIARALEQGFEFEGYGR